MLSRLCSCPLAKISLQLCPVVRVQVLAEMQAAFLVLKVPPSPPSPAHTHACCQSLPPAFLRSTCAPAAAHCCITISTWSDAIGNPDQVAPAGGEVAHASVMAWDHAQTASGSCIADAAYRLE